MARKAPSNLQFMGPDTPVSAAEGRGNEYRHTTNYKKTEINVKSIRKGLIIELIFMEVVLCAGP